MQQSFSEIRFISRCIDVRDSGLKKEGETRSVLNNEEVNNLRTQFATSSWGGSDLAKEQRFNMNFVKTRFLEYYASKCLFMRTLQNYAILRNAGLRNSIIFSDFDGLLDHRNYWTFGYKALIINDTCNYRNIHVI